MKHSVEQPDKKLLSYDCLVGVDSIMFCCLVQHSGPESLTDAVKLIYRYSKSSVLIRSSSVYNVVDGSFATLGGNAVVTLLQEMRLCKISKIQAIEKNILPNTALTLALPSPCMMMKRFILWCLLRSICHISNVVTQSITGQLFFMHTLHADVNLACLSLATDIVFCSITTTGHCL